MKFRSGPSVLALTRQGLPQLQGSSAAAVAKGGYILQDTDAKEPDLVCLRAVGWRLPLRVVRGRSW